jgi:hypothetical protein
MVCAGISPRLIAPETAAWDTPFLFAHSAVEIKPIGFPPAYMVIIGSVLVKPHLKKKAALFDISGLT